MAGLSIGVIRGVVSDSETAIAALTFVTRTNVLSGSLLSGASSTLSTIDLSWFKDTNSKDEGWVAGYFVIFSWCSEVITTLLISESGLTYSITINYWSTSKETDKLIAPPAEAPTLVALFLCFCSQASSLNLFFAACFFAFLRGEGVESLEGFAGAFFTFFLPLHLYSRSSSSSEVLVVLEEKASWSQYLSLFGLVL